MSYSLPPIILVRPQLPQNIGFCARSMMNFGFSDLRIVNPKEEWPNDIAITVSKGGSSVAKNARVFDSIADACYDIGSLCATTSRSRFTKKINYDIRELASKVMNEIQENPVNPVDTNSSDSDQVSHPYGLLFGQESIGLTNEDLAFAESVVFIPTNPDYLSLNLGISVSIVCYEFSVAFSVFAEHSINHNARKKHKEHYADSNISVKELECLFNFLEKKLIEKKFFSKPDRQASAVLSIKNILTRMNLTKGELGTLTGIFRLIE